MAAVLLRLVGLFSCGYCKLLHSVVIFPHSGGCFQLARVSLIQIHTPILAVVVSGNMTNHRMTKMIKQQLRQEGRLRPSSSELKPGFPLNIIPALIILLLCIPFIDLNFFLHFLSSTVYGFKAKATAIND